MRSSTWEKSNNGTVCLFGPLKPVSKMVPMSGPKTVHGQTSLVISGINRWRFCDSLFSTDASRTPYIGEVRQHRLFHSNVWRLQWRQSRHHQEFLTSYIFLALFIASASLATSAPLITLQSLAPLRAPPFGFGAVLLILAPYLVLAPFLFLAPIKSIVVNHLPAWPL